MSDFDESLRQLLSNASPRPVPSKADESVAREALRAEWCAVSGKHRSGKRLVRYAMAATILIGVFSLFNVFRVPSVEIVRVASIQKSFGSIYVLGEQSELTLANNLNAIYSGQIIVTGNDAGMALSWGEGASVRLDRDTKVEFSDGDTVYLWSGQIYIDSVPSGFIAGNSTGAVNSIQIETEHGVVSHVGTQFMTQVNSIGLTVSVREGQVDIAGQYYPYAATRGEQVAFSGRQRPVVLSIPEYGDMWDWVSHASPTIDADGKSVHAFLTWVGRELGMSIKYANGAVEAVAREALLEGDVDKDPAEALRLRMLTTALDWSYVEGVIYVSNGD
jgi:FecR protein